MTCSLFEPQLRDRAVLWADVDKKMGLPLPPSSYSRAIVSPQEGQDTAFLISPNYELQKLLFHASMAEKSGVAFCYPTPSYRVEALSEAKNTGS